MVLCFDLQAERDVWIERIKSVTAGGGGDAAPIPGRSQTLPARGTDDAAKEEHKKKKGFLTLKRK